MGWTICVKRQMMTTTIVMRVFFCFFWWLCGGYSVWVGAGKKGSVDVWRQARRNESSRKILPFGPPLGYRPPALPANAVQNPTQDHGIQPVGTEILVSTMSPPTSSIQVLSRPAQL